MIGLGPSEMVIVGIVAILLFGKRLPEVAKSIGKSYREFRSGLNEFHSAVDVHSSESSSASSRYNSAPRDYDDYEEPTAPKFDPPPMEPTVASAPPAADSTSSNEVKS